MLDDLIDDEVRRSFPGFSDDDIREFYQAAKAAEVENPQIFESDLSHARIIRELGWDAFKEYLRSAVGIDELDNEDIVRLAEACTFLREIDNTTMYAAIYGAASEVHSKKTASVRKESYKNLMSPIKNIDVIKGV